MEKHGTEKQEQRNRKTGKQQDLKAGREKQKHWKTGICENRNRETRHWKTGTEKQENLKAGTEKHLKTGTCENKVEGGGAGITNGRGKHQK